MTPNAIVQRVQRNLRFLRPRVHPARRGRPLAGARGLDLVATMTLLGPTAWSASPRA